MPSLTPPSSLTPHHAKYFAWELTRRRAASEEDRLSQSLFDASVDLNPHQIDAALFALHNPLSKGVMLADEVGLGKTIEAALVLCQMWAERRRRLLVICPAALRKQWAQELSDKFNLPTQVLDALNLEIAPRARHLRPIGSRRHQHHVAELCSPDGGAAWQHSLGFGRHR